jgi:hypothetical protein
MHTLNSFRIHMCRVRVMVLYATFNNISVISVAVRFIGEETGGSGENHRSAACHWQTLSHNVVSSTPRLWGIRTRNVGGDRYTDCIGSYKSNYHAITTTTACISIVLNGIVFVCTYSFLCGFKLWRHHNIQFDISPDYKLAIWLT